MGMTVPPTPAQMTLTNIGSNLRSMTQQIIAVVIGSIVATSLIYLFADGEQV